MISLGIDIGSRNTKIVLYEATQGIILHSAWQATETSPRRGVEALLKDAGEAASEIRPEATACTGYGRKLYSDTARLFSEISCHAAGVRYFYPGARTIIDIGGQDSKIITLEAGGKVRDFAMNDKCAAGTGRFLEMTALRLDCPISGLAALADRSTRQLSLSSTCVVFAESEIVGLIAAATEPADIARAVHESIAKRVLSQLSALEFAPPLVFTGGVAQDAALAACLAAQLQEEVSVPPDPEITAALGAAILAVP